MQIGYKRSRCNNMGYKTEIVTTSGSRRAQGSGRMIH